MNHINTTILLAAVGLSAAALPALTADPVSPPADSSAAAGPAWAGDHQGALPHQDWSMAQHRFKMRRLIRRLNLTDAQLAQLRHLHAQTMADMWSAKSDGNLTVDQLHAKIRAAFRAEHDGFRNLLTDQQRAQLDQMTHRSEVSS